MQARITALWRYPVKACAGEPVPSLTLDARGWPEADRGWAVINAQQELTWLGAEPRLALVQARWAPAGLTLQATGHTTLTLPPDAGTPRTVRAWNELRRDVDLLAAWDAGDAAARWLQAVTGATLRLVRLDPDVLTRDGLNALHVVSQAALDAWQAALATPLGHLAQRVRPNLVLQALEGDDLPFIEESTRRIVAPAAALRITSPCVRCVVPNVDPTTGTPHESAFQTLHQLSLQRVPGDPTRFGAYARGEGAGALRVGDVVTLELDFGDA
jgi:hypothetical protein